MARDEAREWFRDRPGASFAEFNEWVTEVYEPDVLRAGFGWKPGVRPDRKIQETLDDAHIGLHLARDDENRRRDGAAA